MIGKLVITNREIWHCGPNKTLPAGSTGIVVREGLDGWIVKLDCGGEMWCKDYELEEYLPLFGHLQVAQLKTGHSGCHAP